MLLTTVAGIVSDSDVHTLQEANTAALHRGGRFISLVDVTLVTAAPTALQRKNYASWREAHFEELRRHVIAVAFIVGDRPLLRGGLTALSWVAPHPSPERYFADRNEAVAWLESRLASEGVPRTTSWRPSIRLGSRSRPPGANRGRRF